MNAADMGWWKADLTTLNYECSEYISELLGLDDSGIISFEDFNKRILKEEQRPTTVHSFSEQQMSEVVYLLEMCIRDSVRCTHSRLSTINVSIR